jgi:hypothetical protein
MMNQKEATYAAIKSVLANDKIHHEDGMDVADHMNKARRAIVNDILFHSFRAGEVKLDREFTDKELKTYVSGLQSNWIRKDTRLNGGAKYEAANPGSRAGSGDATLKAMRNLLTTLTTPEDKAEVQGCIDAHLAELAKSKVKSIDWTKLPPELLAKYTTK